MTESETISVKCLNCGQTSQAPAAYAGRSAKCRRCDASIVIPERLGAVGTEPSASQKSGSDSAATKKVLAALGRELVPDAERYAASRERYRELVWYLQTIRWVSSAYLVAAIVLPPIWLLYSLARDVLAANESIEMLIFRLFGTLMLCLLMVLTAFLIRIAVQSVDVILDMEASTRQTAEALLRITPAP